jgi:hypothetical protein
VVQFERTFYIPTMHQLDAPLGSKGLAIKPNILRAHFQSDYRHSPPNANAASIPVTNVTHSPREVLDIGLFRVLVVFSFFGFGIGVGVGFDFLFFFILCITLFLD